MQKCVSDFLIFMLRLYIFMPIQRKRIILNTYRERKGIIMGVNGIYNSTVSEMYSANTTAKDKEVDKKDTDKTTQTDNSESKASATESDKTANKPAAVYDKRKLSEADRKAITEQLKAEQEKRQQQLLDLVRKTMSTQTTMFGQATDDDVWKFLAKGDFTVDAETKKKAQEAISEDGYWGVKQTSDRIVEFATALAGNDKNSLEKMKDAFLKGYKQAEKTWGGKLPDISKKTYDAVMEKFDKLLKPEEETETDDKADKKEDTVPSSGMVVEKN